MHQPENLPFASLSRKLRHMTERINLVSLGVNQPGFVRARAPGPLCPRGGEFMWAALARWALVVWSWSLLRSFHVSPGHFSGNAVCSFVGPIADSVVPMWLF